MEERGWRGRSLAGSSVLPFWHYVAQKDGMVSEKLSTMQAAPTSQVQSHSLPIKQVTLYKNDLAFLKRRGKDSTAQLEIAESIKDLVSSTLNVSSDAPVAVLFGPNTEPASEPDYVRIYILCTICRADWLSRKSE